LGTFAITDSAPSRSPPIVVYPTAFSLMSPVWRNRAPELFAQFHMRAARMRACTFWRVISVGSSPASISRVASTSRSNASSMGMTRKGMPSSSARIDAASRVPSPE
jgi:hypothetical protein